MADIAASVLTRLKNKAQASGRSYQWVLESMRSTIIKLPAKDDKPDFDFMENYI